MWEFLLLTRDWVIALLNDPWNWVPLSRGHSVKPRCDSWKAAIHCLSEAMRCFMIHFVWCNSVFAWSLTSNSRETSSLWEAILTTFKRSYFSSSDLVFGRREERLENDKVLNQLLPLKSVTLGTGVLMGRLALGSVQQMWALLLAKLLDLGWRSLTSEHNFLQLSNGVILFRIIMIVIGGFRVPFCVFLWIPSNIYLRTFF